MRRHHLTLTLTLRETISKEAEMRNLIVVFSVLLILAGRWAGAATPPKELEPLSFLLGEWSGGGSGTPGQGSGGSTFARSLQDRVIIRTNFALTAATPTTPPSRHDDLMIIYVDEKGAVRADYYDNEGHVIRYLVTAAGARSVSFVSEVAPNAPRYRLTYTAATGGVVKGTFEMAPPGKPEAFAQYLGWEMTKVPPGTIKNPESGSAITGQGR
jgi:hypothetical protein